MASPNTGCHAKPRTTTCIALTFATPRRDRQRRIYGQLAVLLGTVQSGILKYFQRQSIQAVGYLIYWSCRVQVTPRLAHVEDSLVQAVIFLLALLQPPLADSELAGAALVRLSLFCTRVKLTRNCCLLAWPPLLAAALADPAVHAAAVRRQPADLKLGCLLTLLPRLFHAVTLQYPSDAEDEDAAEPSLQRQQLNPLLQASVPVTIHLLRDLLPQLGTYVHQETSKELEFVETLVDFIAFPQSWGVYDQSCRVASGGIGSHGGSSTLGLKHDINVSGSNCLTSCSCVDSMPDSGSTGDMDSSVHAISVDRTIDVCGSSSKFTARLCHCVAAKSKSLAQDLIELLPAMVALARRSVYYCHSATTADVNIRAAISCYRWLEAALCFGTMIGESNGCIQMLSRVECHFRLTDDQVPAVFPMLIAVCELAAAARSHHPPPLHVQLSRALRLMAAVAHSSSVGAADLMAVLSYTLHTPKDKDVLLTACHISHLNAVILAYDAIAGHCTVAPAGDVSLSNTTLSVSLSDN